MIYVYTGQPGHGKTLHAIDKALEWVDEGREVYACNIRQFQAAKAGMIEITPEQFCNWQEWAPDGAAFIIDEAYEHRMLPKRAPASEVPLHVQQLAKHRHRGLDFIFVAQSPGKQMDVFVHDLIERHTHVRRRFGTKFVHLRIFDRFEPNPAKAFPLVLQRVRLPKRPMGLYESTKQDTTEKKIPWYYPAAVVLCVAIVGGVAWSVSSFFGVFKNEPHPVTTQAGTGENGARAKVEPGTAKPGTGRTVKTKAEYAREHLPRFATMPWTAPVFDGRAVVAEPDLICMASEHGADGSGNDSPGGCTCHTEQGTRYDIAEGECRRVAKFGRPYNPYKRRQNERQESGAGQRPAAMAARAADPVRVTSTGAPYGSPPVASGAFALDPSPANPL